MDEATRPHKTQEQNRTESAIPENTAPPLPVRPGLEAGWESKHGGLYRDVKKTLMALPANFEAEIEIAGMDATDLFGLNSVLGSAIERNVVETLNKFRAVWDPNGAYATYSFIRYPQSFPDVRLVDRNQNSQEPILMGIELKGWFAFSKEEEPSFRFEVTPRACAMQDLLVVVPWMLSNVISGKPKVLSPFVDEARYAALLRNHHWVWIRGSGKPEDQVTTSQHASPYPAKVDASSDKAVQDKGKNFGRVARTNVLSGFTKQTLAVEAAGIPIRYWVQFLKAFSENASNLDTTIANLSKQVRKKSGPDSPNNETVIEFLTALLTASQKKA